MSKCIGCGVKIQNTDPKKIGYTQKKDAKYCERCFRINNYNEAKIVNNPIIKDKFLNKINEKDGYVLFISDFLNLTKEVVDTYNKIKTRKCLIINKIDILPKSIKLSRISDYLKATYNISDDIIYISTKKNIGILKIKNIVEDKKSVYVVGFTNSGKSSLINSLKKTYAKKDDITTSIIPNTTIDFMKINLGGNIIYDTPGVYYDHSIYNLDDINIIKKTNCKEIIKPKTLQIKENDSILIENMILIKCDVPNSFTFYMSNLLDIKKVYKESLKEIEKEYFLDSNKDLIVKGLGFINIKNKTKLKIITKDQDLIEIRDSIIGK